MINYISSVISAGLKVEMTELHSREIQQVMTFREMKYGTWKKSLFFFFWTNSYFFQNGHTNLSYKKIKTVTSFRILQKISISNKYWSLYS